MLFTALISKFVAYRHYRKNVRSLAALSDRQLSDIGVSRGNIEAVARDLAFH